MCFLSLLCLSNLERSGLISCNLTIYSPPLLTSIHIQVPLGPWTKDAKLKELGRFERVHMIETVEPHGMALFTRVLGYTMDEARILFANVKREFRDRTLHMYTVYRFIYGRKAR